MSVRRAYLESLVQDVEMNLERFEPSSGRFLTGGGWAVTNQDVVYPLALLYVTEDPSNPYYGDERILDHVARGADAWRDFQYPDGRVEFIKIDGSQWGPTYMPWSMYHWLETYALLRDTLDAQRRRSWEEGLALAYGGIARGLEANHVHNIPTWNGMALYRAGQLFGRPEWLDRGKKTIDLAVNTQTPQGYWREHHGPTTSYNLVYVHAIGLYHVFSGDDSLLPCLERGTDFHIRYTYPDGRVVETIDGRVKYHDRVPDLAHAAFSLFPQGRSFVRFLVENMVRLRREHPLPHLSYADTRGKHQIVGANYGLSARLASGYVHYRDGPAAPIPQDSESYAILDPDHALLRHADGWFTCLSGITTPPVDNRWGQDRQSFCSVWHKSCGLLIGGGNSREQPEWSSFVVEIEGGTAYLPDSAQLERDGDVDTVKMTYAGCTCTLSTQIVSADHLQLTALGATGQPSRAQFLLQLDPAHALRTGLGDQLTLNADPISLSAEKAGGAIEHRGWRVVLPPGSRVEWPVLPFNPYTEDGAAPVDEAVAILSVPLEQEPATISIKIADA